MMWCVQRALGRRDSQACARSTHITRQQQTSIRLAASGQNLFDDSSFEDRGQLVFQAVLFVVQFLVVKPQ
jgi:hypothetical protein